MPYRETLQHQTLQYIIKLIADYYETMTVEKSSLSDARQSAHRSAHKIFNCFTMIILLYGLGFVELGVAK